MRLWSVSFKATCGDEGSRWWKDDVTRAKAEKEVWEGRA